MFITIITGTIYLLVLAFIRFNSVGIFLNGFCVTHCDVTFQHTSLDQWKTKSTVCWYVVTYSLVEEYQSLNKSFAFI
jgi:hypothetical protein